MQLPRCWQQKRRFGIDFLYPVDRYVDALTKTTVADREGNLVVMELKVTEDPDMPLQSLDYWGRVIGHNLSGDFDADGRRDLLVRDRGDRLSVYDFISRQKGFSEEADFDAPLLL